MARFPAPPNYRRADINPSTLILETKNALDAELATPPPSVVPTFLDLSTPAGVILNGHDFGTVTITEVEDGDGFYEITWTGSGGNANDTLPEQLILLYQVPDTFGETVDLTTKSHILRWYTEFDPDNWNGDNSVIVGTGPILCSGSTFEAPGTAQSGSVCIGAFGGLRIRNSSFVTGQSATGNSISRVHQVWVPDEEGTSDVRGVATFTTYQADGTLLEAAETGFETASTAATGLIALGIGLGNDNSLTSGATNTERIRVRAVAYEIS